MADTDIPEPTPETPAPSFAATAIAALDDWAERYTHDSPLSRDTEAYNAVYGALDLVRNVLSQLGD